MLSLSARPPQVPQQEYGNVEQAPKGAQHQTIDESCQHQSRPSYIARPGLQKLLPAWHTSAVGMPRTTIAPDVEAVNREELTPLYRVVLLDDDDHTYDYVIEMLQKIFIFSQNQALRHAEEV